MVRDQYDSMNGLLPIFEMNLPEGALLEKLRNQFAKIIPQFAHGRYDGSYEGIAERIAQFVSLENQRQASTFCSRQGGWRQSGQPAKRSYRSTFARRCRHG
jgi:hypothetical protein